MTESKIAVIRDGYSDFMVLKSLVSSIIKTERNVNLNDENFIDFEDLQIGDAVSKYIDKANKEQETDLNGKRAISLKKKIIAVLYTAIKKEGLCNKSILILNADAEHKLMQKEVYFKTWVRQLYSVINTSIEEFYDKMVKEGYSYQNLPLIIPLILFPSIEILVASCYLSDNEKTSFRKLRAKPDLKKKVWDTENIPYAIDTGKITEVLNLCFVDNDNSLNEIYQYIPEARNFIQTLTYPEKQKEKHPNIALENSGLG